MNRFSKNLELLMKENGISQERLAELLKVKQQTVSRYVNGQREPDLDMVMTIAKIFEVTVDYLLSE